MADMPQLQRKHMTSASARAWRKRNTIASETRVPQTFFARAAFKPAERLFVEPQAALTWAWVEGDDFRAGRSFTVHQDDYQSLIGRVGVRAGLEFPNEKSTFYARVSGAWEMMGEDEYHAVADAGRVESFRTELDGGWSEYAVGANFKLAPNAFVWADLEKIAGGDIRENYRYTISTPGLVRRLRGL